MRRQTGFLSGLLPSFLFFLCFLLDFAAATITNRTIDDTYGDSVTGKAPSFMPFNGGVWADQTCAGCAIKADTSKAFAGTYKAATYAPDLNNVSISMGFEGTAIYVFFILANNQGDGITTITMVNFTLDGQAAGSFTHIPDTGTTSFQYNSSVFSKTGLNNTAHQLVISTTGVAFNTFTSFDYAVYTHDDGISTSSTSTSTSTSTSIQSSSVTPGGSSAGTHTVPIGAIVGGVVGGLAVIGALVGLLFYRRRRSRQSQTGGDGVLGGVLGGEMPPAMSQPPYSAAVAQPMSASAADLSTPFLVAAPYSQRQSYSRNHSFAQDASGSSQFNSSTIGSQFMVANPDPDVNSSTYDPYQDHASSDRPGAASSTHQGNNSDWPRGQLMLSVGGYETLAAPVSAATTNFSGYSAGQTAISSSVSTTTADAHIPGSSSVAGPQKPLSKIQLEKRRARQNELDQRLRAVRQEMQDLSFGLHAGVARRESKIRTTEEASGPGRVRTEEEVTEMREMRNQMKVMKEQIEFLQAQQRSEWAQGLSNDPPPGYNA